MYKKTAPTNFGFGSIGQIGKNIVNAGRQALSNPGQSIKDTINPTKKGLFGSVFDGTKVGGAFGAHRRMMGGLFNKGQGGQGGSKGFRGLNEKLDKVLAAVEGGQGGADPNAAAATAAAATAAAAGQPQDAPADTAAAEEVTAAEPAQDAAPPPPAPETENYKDPENDGSALAMKSNAFMGTSQQSPYSNKTGGKNPTFSKDTAMRMMAVADPNTKTSGLLFTGPGDDKKGLEVTPTIKVKHDDIANKSKQNVALETNKFKVGGAGKIGFSAGVDHEKKQGYKGKVSPSAKVKLKIDLNKILTNKQKKKSQPKHDW